MRRIALFKFAAVIFCILLLVGCAWNVKSTSGKDILNLSPFRIEKSGSIKVKVRGDSDYRLKPLRVEDELSTKSVTLGAEKLLSQELIINKTVLSEVIDLLGEPIRGAFQPEEIKLYYNYNANWKKGYYRLTLRKIDREIKFTYGLEITLSKSDDPTPKFIISAFDLKLDLEPQYVDDWDPLKLGGKWIGSGGKVAEGGIKAATK